MSYTVLKNVNIIPMNEEKIIEGVDLLVEGGKITKIGAGEIPGDAQVVAGDGKFVTPGLCDMHMHLFTENDINLYLPNGVTTVRNMWGEPAFNAWRDKINAGEMTGPTVYNCGQILDGDPPVRPPDVHNVTVKTPEAGRKEVFRTKEEGYDFIKVYDILAPDVYEAIAEASKECDIKFIGHVPHAVGFEKVVAAGQYSVEHISYLAMSDLELAAKSGIWICPTVIVMNMMVEIFECADSGKLFANPRLKFIDKETANFWEMTLKNKDQFMEDPSNGPALKALLEKSRYEKVKPIVQKAYQLGCKLLLGSDTPNPFVFPGFSIHEELALLVDCGLSTFDALKTGTVNAAECLETSEKTGTIETGKIADLLVLDENPLQDIKNTEKIFGVMKNGQWFDKRAIDELLVKVEEACKEQ